MPSNIKTHQGCKLPGGEPLAPRLAIQDLADLFHLVLIAGIVTMTGAQKTQRHHVVHFVRSQALEGQMQRPAHLRERRPVLGRALLEKVLQGLGRIEAGARPQKRKLSADRQRLAEIKPGVSILPDTKHLARAPGRSSTMNLSTHP